MNKKVLSWPKSDADHLIVSSAQMIELEQAIFARGMPIAALMEKVGLRIRDWFLGKSELVNEEIVVLVGPGHNGADGLVLARELYLAGMNIYIWCPFGQKKDLTKKHFEYCTSIGIENLQNEPEPRKKNIWIDALFGLSQDRPVPDNIENLFKLREEKQPDRLISLDVPTGICSDNGTLLSGFVPFYSYTLSIGLFKQGLLQDKALPYVGKLVRIDIGLPSELVSQYCSGSPLILSSEDLLSLPFPTPAANTYKYKRGRALLLVGSDIYLGAGNLALQGALASGVGSVNAVIPKVLSESLWEIYPEVLISGLMKTSAEGKALLASSLNEQDLQRADSVLIGPGIGVSKEKWEDSESLLADYSGLLVIDADAINRIAASSKGWEWLLSRQGPTWLTPHKKEFNLLFPDLTDLEPLEAASMAARKSESTVLLKGADSVIASPRGEVWQLADTSSSSARIGLGDVLAGFAAGIGALSVSVGKGNESHFLAASALLHSHAAKNCLEGSTASLISNFLSKLVKSKQSENVFKNTLNSDK